MILVACILVLAVAAIYWLAKRGGTPLPPGLGACTTASDCNGGTCVATPQYGKVCACEGLMPGPHCEPGRVTATPCKKDSDCGGAPWGVCLRSGHCACAGRRPGPHCEASS
jgi:hypothetical protein